MTSSEIFWWMSFITGMIALHLACFGKRTEGNVLFIKIMFGFCIASILMCLILSEAF